MSLLQQYKDWILSKNKSCPDPKKDALRFSGLHSWYKKLGKLSVAYPLLMSGEEAAYPFSPDYSDNNQNFHWRFILEDYIKGYGIEIDGKMYADIPQELLEYMKRFPVYLSSDFGCKSSAHDFQIEICNETCKNFWNNLQ